MRVLLVKAFRKTRSTSGITPPLGIMYLASYLRKYGIDNISIFDMRMSGSPYVEVQRRIEKFKPDIIGISALTVEYDSLQTLAEMAKKINKKILVVAGGPHATAYTSELMSNQNIDIAVMNEGEETFIELCSKYDAGLNYRQIKGIAYRQNGNVEINPQREFISDLDSLPFPAWDLIDLNAYAKQPSMASLGRRPYMTLMTSRACPFKCIYCHNIFGKTFRYRSPDNIFQEMILLRERYNIREFEILDDVFNLDRKRAMNFYSLVSNYFPDALLSFPNGLRTDMLDEEQIKMMKKSGVIYVAVAIESANERLQKMMRKYLNLKKASEIIELYSDYRIFTNGFFMIGFPTETREEVLNTINYAVNSQLHTAQFFIVTPFKGTELFELYREHIKNFRIDFAKHEFYFGEYNLSNLQDSELFKLQKIANWKFYARPSRLRRIWRDYPRKKELFKYMFTPLKRTIFVKREGKNVKNITN
jgi:radical SAM superfamily enzyme YgiQ (UPF0313 family)